MILLGILVLALILPENPIAEGIEISLKKICQIFLVVSAIQIISLAVASKLNSHLGTLIHGLLAGMISSTVLTLHLAKKSKAMDEESLSIESLSFLSATAAMLLQGIILYLVTNNKADFNTLLLFLVPLVVTIFLIIKRVIHTKDRNSSFDDVTFNWFVIGKLALLVIFIIIISNLIKSYLGDVGLRIMTFFISLFELHGMVIASTQLFVSNKISLSFFNELVTLTLLAGYISKVGIILSLGSSYLKKKVGLWSALICLSIIGAWALITI